MTAPTGPVGPGLDPLAIPGWGGFDPVRTQGGGQRARLAMRWRSFRTAAQLGWAMEANWTDPLLFLIYSVAKPVSAALILVVMLEVIGGAASREYRGFVVTGSAWWACVLASIAGLACACVADRERYRLLT